MQDILTKTAGNKMGSLRQEIVELRQMLREEKDTDKQAVLRKTIMEKETYYNILADRRRMNADM
jgi:hypothetical protein